MEGMSEREYSAHSGLSRGAIQKARKTGRLVLFRDGSINAAASDVRRAAMTDPDQQRRARGGATWGDAGPSGAGMTGPTPSAPGEGGSYDQKGIAVTLIHADAHKNEGNQYQPPPEAAHDQMASRTGGRTVLFAEMPSPPVWPTFTLPLTALAVCQAQEIQPTIQKMKGTLLDGARVETLVFRLVRQERDTWVIWRSRPSTYRFHGC